MCGRNMAVPDCKQLLHAVTVRTSSNLTTNTKIDNSHIPKSNLYRIIPPIVLSEINIYAMSCTQWFICFKLVQLQWTIFAAINVLKLKSSNDVFYISISFIEDTCDNFLQIKLQLGVEWLADILPIWRSQERKSAERPGHTAGIFRRLPQWLKKNCEMAL